MTLHSFNRWSAFAAHFVLSALIAATVVALVMWIWYPAPYFTAMGGDTLLRLLIGVDVALGPFITLIIFDTGKARLKMDLAIIAVLQVAAGRSQAVQGQTRRKMEMAHGAFLTTLQAEEQLIGHVTATAAFDPDGSALVAAQLDRTLTNLAKFGPRQAFDAGGLHFDADPARLGVLGADDLVKTAQDLGASARGQWVQHAADALPDAKAKQAFADDLVKRYKDNDPLLAGFGPPPYTVRPQGSTKWNSRRPLLTPALARRSS